MYVMRQPEVNDDGEVIPHDHDEISNNHSVIRRISHYFVVEDSKTGEKKVSSMAFDKSSGENGSISVDLPSLMELDSVDVAGHVTSPVWIGSVTLNVGEIRGLTLSVGYDPTDENKYHGGIWGGVTRGVKRKLLSHSSWYVEIAGVNL